MFSHVVEYLCTPSIYKHLPSHLQSTSCLESFTPLNLTPLAVEGYVSQGLHFSLIICFQPSSWAETSSERPTHLCGCERLQMLAESGKNWIPFYHHVAAHRCFLNVLFLFWCSTLQSFQFHELLGLIQSPREESSETCTYFCGHVQGESLRRNCLESICFFCGQRGNVTSQRKKEWFNLSINSKHTKEFQGYEQNLLSPGSTVY